MDCAGVKPTAFLSLALLSERVRSQADSEKFKNKSALKDESGQATLEYILLLLVVFSLALGLSKTFTTNLDSSMRRLGGQLEKDLKTGRAPVSVWQN